MLTSLDCTRRKIMYIYHIKIMPLVNRIKSWIRECNYGDIITMITINILGPNSKTQTFSHFSGFWNHQFSNLHSRPTSYAKHFA